MNQLLEDYIKILKSTKFQIAFVTMLTIALTGIFFWDYLMLSYVPGWDGSSHFAVNQIYSQDIFPNLFGWIENWNAGQPWPVGYPPLMTYIFTFLFLLFPGYEIAIFKVFFIILVLATPGVTYLAVKKARIETVSPFVSSLLVLALMLSNNNSYLVSGGFNIRSTFEVGLYPQFMASLLFILFIPVVVRVTESKKASILSIVLLSLILLTNLHTAQAAFILLAISLFAKLITKQRSFKAWFAHCLGIALGVIGLTAFWLVPVLSASPYLLTQTDIPIVLIEFIRSNIVLILFSSVIGAIAIKKSYLVSSSIWISALVIILIASIPINEIFPGLPIQSNRLIPSALILLSIVTGALVNVLIQARTKYKYLLLAFFIVSLSSNVSMGRNIANVNTLDQNDVKLVEYLKQQSEGRILVESWYKANETSPSFRYTPIHSIITGLVATNSNVESLWGVFRESSLNMPFIQPIRNSFSAEWRESYAVFCYLCDNRTYNPYEEVYSPFYELSAEEKIERAKIFGVKHLAIYSNTTKQELNELEESVRWKTNFGNWSIYEIDETHTTGGNSFVFTDATLLTKSRGVDSYDWYRINEEWLLSLPDMRFVNDSKLTVDSPELASFSNVFITNYKYKDLFAAVRNIDEISQQGNVYLLESDDKLYTYFESNRSPNIFTLERKNGVRDNLNIIFETFIESEKTSIETTVSSYFPWRRNSSNDLLISPAFAASSIEDTQTTAFEVPNYIFIGYIISLISVAALTTAYKRVLKVSDSNLKKIKEILSRTIKYLSKLAVLGTKPVNRARLQVSIVLQAMDRLLVTHWHQIIVWFISIVVIAIFANNFLTGSLVGGWDGEFHYVGSLVMKDQLVGGRFNGWIEGWNMGMPWPTGYTPGLSILFALLYMLFPYINSLTIFKLVVILAVSLIPVLMVRLTSNLTKSKVAGLIVGLLVVINYLDGKRLFLSDLTFTGIFELGNYPFTIALIPALLALNISFNKEASLKTYLTMGVMISATLIINVHVFLFVIGLTALSQYKIVKNKDLGMITKLIVASIINLVAVSPWVITLISNREFFLSNPIAPITLGEFARVITPVVFIGIAGALHSLVKGSNKSKTIAGYSVLIALLSLTNLVQSIEGALWQPNRIVLIAFLTMLIPATEMIISLAKVRKQRLLILTISIALVITYISGYVQPASNRFELDEEHQQLLEQLDALEGRIIIENWIGDSYLNPPTQRELARDIEDFSDAVTYTNVISARLGLSNTAQSLWGVYRESSISAPFIQPIRNYYSGRDESFGVVCWLCFEPHNDLPTLTTSLQLEDPEIVANKLNTFGVNFVVVRSSEALSNIDRTQLRLNQRVGEWHIYENMGSIESSEIPVLIYTDLQNGYREANSYDWLRLNEEWLNLKKPSFRYVRAKTGGLDASTDFLNFPVTVIEEFDYRDIDKVEVKLKEYSKKHLLYIYETNDPLFNRLVKAGQDTEELNIVALPRSGEIRAESTKFNNDILFRKDITKQISLPKETYYHTADQSYFPFWKDSFGGTVYMTSPTSTLILSKLEKYELEYAPPF